MGVRFVSLKHFDSMENEYMKRGYLLPPGCKDLSDALKLKQKHAQSLMYYFPHLPTGHDTTAKSGKTPEAWQPVTGQIFVGPGTSVKKLATLLGQKPFQIIGELMKLGVFVQTDSLLNFEMIAKIARIYGFTAIKG